MAEMDLALRTSFLFVSSPLPQNEDLMAGSHFLINGDFQLNQRAFAGGALSAGAYGFDRWYAGSSGAVVSVSGDTVTLSLGELHQVLEAELWGSLAGKTMVVSCEDLTGGNLHWAFGTRSGTITAGSGRVYSRFTMDSSTGPYLFQIGLTSGPVTFKRLKLEESAARPSTWSPRARPIERLLALRREFKAPTHAVVLDELTGDPGGASDGDTYLVVATATGAWAGKEDQIAIYEQGLWRFQKPSLGWTVYVEATGSVYRWT